MTADRVAASAAEVGVILAISDQHVRDSIDELAALGAPAVSIAGQQRWRLADLARAVDGPDAAPLHWIAPLVWRVDEVAAQLGLRERQVRTAIDLGQLEGVLRIGRTVRISRAAVARLAGTQVA